MNLTILCPWDNIHHDTRKQGFNKVSASLLRCVSTNLECKVQYDCVFVSALTWTGGGRKTMHFGDKKMVWRERLHTTPLQAKKCHVVPEQLDLTPLTFQVNKHRRAISRAGKVTWRKGSNHNCWQWSTLLRFCRGARQSILYPRVSTLTRCRRQHVDMNAFSSEAGIRLRGPVDPEWFGGCSYSFKRELHLLTESRYQHHYILT